MSAKHPSCAINVRFRPADYLRIRTASLALEISPEQFVRALILSAMEYYDQENPREVFGSDPAVKATRKVRRLLIDSQEREARSRRRTDANRARVADIPTELMRFYARLRKMLGADEAKRIIGEEVKRGRKAGAK